MDKFFLRRAVERLRGGLFDSIAVNRLTVEEDQIKKAFSKGLKTLEKGKSDHLCICGSYGQGKSHTINYLNQLALSQGYATSIVQLDLREVPFHQFLIVYQSIMGKLSLPDGKKFIDAWKKWASKDSLESFEGMPHRFRMVLKAMLSKGKQLSSEENLLNKPRTQSKEHASWLEKVLMGYNIPAAHLKSVMKNREVEGYQEQTLSCSGNASYVQMVHALGAILREMGYKGLLLFFDEAESIGQGRVNHRVKSYQILDQFFQGNSSIFPIFTFTDDFFIKVQEEQYDVDIGVFPKNYAEAWKDLNILHLQNFSSRGWASLLDRLMELYAEAYQVALPPQVKPSLQALLGKVESQETRYKLKALVNQLDIETQQALLDA